MENPAVSKVETGMVMKIEERTVYVPIDEV